MDCLGVFHRASKKAGDAMDLHENVLSCLIFIVRRRSVASLPTLDLLRSSKDSMEQEETRLLLGSS